MRLKAFLKLPVVMIHLPTVTDKWNIAEVAYFLACDCATSGYKNPKDIDYSINAIYNWLDSLLEYEDEHMIDIIVEKIYNLMVSIFRDADFQAAINAPYELVECTARVHRGERYVSIYFDYEVEDVYSHVENRVL